MNRALFMAMCIAAIAAIGFGAHALLTAIQQTPSLTPQALHDASSAIRDQQDAADDLVELGLITNGMEAGKAGFHLLRPVTDPLWSAQYGRLQPHYDYRWFDVPVRYQDIEYQRRLPISFHPGFIEPLAAVVSQERNISSTLGSASVQPDGNGLYRVVFAFPPRGVAALQGLLQPTTTFPATNEYADWYRMKMPDGAASTPMEVAVVASHVTYLPILVQDVVASATSAGASVIVADGLSEAEAIDLASKLNSP